MDATPCTDGECHGGICRTGCLSDGDCDDATDCTTDACVDWECHNEAQHDLCADDNPCTEDVCASGVGCSNAALQDGTPCGGDLICVAGECRDGCTTTADCDDGVACTIDQCTNGACQHTTMDALCEDGNDCTTDICHLTQGCFFPPTPRCCGNGFTEYGEGCDDANDADWDGCTACEIDR